MLASTAPDMLPDRVAAMRAFNRFYTRRIGVVTEGMHETPHSLPEARVLYELGLRPVTEVADLRRELGIDGGHLSRLLARMDAKGLITRERSESDGRRQRVRMTSAGAAARSVLDERSALENRQLLDGLDDGDQHRLLEALDTVRELLGDTPATPTIVLRAAEVGDLGWMVERHGTSYAHEFGWWDPRFEALCARIVADFGDGHDPAREATWIAEVNGRRAGCIMCVDRGDGVAQLRLLFVEPGARGFGLGTRLVDECMRFAVRAGYREMRLWTNSALHAARRVYQRAGFTLVEETEDADGFAPDPIFQTWARAL